MHFVITFCQKKDTVCLSVGKTFTTQRHIKRFVYHIIWTNLCELVIFCNVSNICRFQMLNQSSCQGIQEGKFLQVNKHKTVNMTDVIPLPKKQKQEMAQIVWKFSESICILLSQMNLRSYSPTCRRPARCKGSFSFLNCSGRWLYCLLSSQYAIWSTTITVQGWKCIFVPNNLFISWIVWFFWIFFSWRGEIGRGRKTTKAIR